jgi:ABC-type polar amino acid transport system ATPase subunit
MVVVTHEMAFARDVATTVVFMDQGRIVRPALPIASSPHPPPTGRGSSWLVMARLRHDLGTPLASFK